MAQKSTPPKKVKVEVRPASNILKIILTILILFSIVALIALRVSIQQSKDRRADLEQQAIQLVQENKALTQNIAKLGTVESVKRIAEAELGLVDPDSQFFTPGN